MGTRYKTSPFYHLSPQNLKINNNNNNNNDNNNTLLNSSQIEN